MQPEIIKALEQSARRLARSGTVSRMDLAPTYHRLWTLTLKPTYLQLFEKTLRHCYLSLARGRHYPGLGVDLDDPGSVSAAISFLDSNRSTLRILSDRYDVDTIINKYRTDD